MDEENERGGGIDKSEDGERKTGRVIMWYAHKNKTLAPYE